MNSEFSFSWTSCFTKAKEPGLPCYLPIAGGRIFGFIPFPRVLVLCEMQSVSSGIRTRVAVSISYDDVHCTTGTSTRLWYMHNPAPVLENDTHKLLWDFDIPTDHLISARRQDLIIINKKKRICKIVNFAVLSDHRIKLKESEKKDKYLDLARELKKLWNMKVTIIPIMIGAFGTVTTGLLKGLDDLEVGGRVETIQTTVLLRTARILRRVLET